MTGTSIGSVAIFVVFGALALALLAVAAMTVAERLQPLVERRSGGASLRETFGNWMLGLRSRRRRRDEEDGDDDLDEATAALLSMLSCASAVVDGNGEVVRANPDAYRLGVVAEDAIADPQVAEAVREVRRTGGRRVIDIETATPERFVGAVVPDGADASRPSTPTGTSRANWLRVTVGRIDERFVVVLIDDVSDEVRFSQTRDAFIVNVSRQLLAPTEALERLSAALKADVLDPDRVRADADSLDRASGHLHHLVSDLLLLIKAQKPITPATANRLSLFDQLSAVVDDERGHAEESGVRLVLSGDEGLSVNGDAEQLRAAVAKLVENAVSVSPQGAAVSVSCARTSDGKHAVIRVIDRGKGIPRSEQPRIFERFYRSADQSARRGDGVGLGLAIVKHVALTHHGQVSVWSAPGEGSTFSIVLPLAA